MQNPYIAYPNRPLILAEDEIEVAGDGCIVVNIAKTQREFYFTDGSVVDLVDHTMFGLIEDLVPGSELSDRVVEEYSGYEEISEYGEWVYYPKSDTLARYAPKLWHQLALLVRNSTLYQDSEMRLGWPGVRERFEKAVVAIAGCSVGNNVAHSVVQSLRPLHIKVGDVKEYKLTNANRVRLSYSDLGRNKAEVTAEQMHDIDPFINISVYTEGVHAGNISDFLEGNDEIGEPAADIVVDETDDPDTKMLLWQSAREAGTAVVMVSDLGSAVQVDVRRFDLRPELSLACGISDEELFEKRDSWKNDLANRGLFYEFVFALVGHNYRHVPEFKRIILKEEEPLFGGVPQLGSTAAMAGGMAAETIARILLGDARPERLFIDKNTGRTIKEGEII